MQEWLHGEITASARFRVRIRLLRGDFGPVDPKKSSKSQASRKIPGADPPSQGGFDPVLVLVVVSGSHSWEADFGLLDPSKSPKSTFSAGSPGPKSPSPGGFGPLLGLVAVGGAHKNLAIFRPLEGLRISVLKHFMQYFRSLFQSLFTSQAWRPQNPPNPRDFNP